MLSTLIIETLSLIYPIIYSTAIIEQHDMPGSILGAREKKN